MKQDHNSEMEAVIASLNGERPKLMLHACCAPCSSAVLERVTPYFDTMLFYYNPNIFPEAEYDKRAGQFSLLLDRAGLSDTVKFIKGPWDYEGFCITAAGYEDEPEGGQRCTLCFLMRLDMTAALAKANGCDYVTTTLTVSPHKNAELINNIGEAMGEKYDIKWLPSDFKKKDGYLRSIRLSEEYGIYRQNYCGCGFSMR